MENIEKIDPTSPEETFGTVFHKINSLIQVKNSLESENMIKRDGILEFKSSSRNYDAISVKNNMDCNNIVVHGEVLFNGGTKLSKDTISIEEFESHINNKNNPHNVRMADIGLSKFTDNYPKAFKTEDEDGNPNGREIEPWELKGCFTDKGRPLSNDEWDALQRYKLDNLGLVTTDKLDDFVDSDSTKRNLVPVGSAVWEYLRWYKKIVIETLYPIGSIYINCSDSRNPSVLFGYGKWEKIATGRTLVSTGDYDIGSTGGNKTITLSSDNIPLHTHTATTTTSGAHTHEKGDWNITGTFQSGGLGRWDPGGTVWGAVSKECSTTWGKDHHGGSNLNFDIVISRNRSGETDLKGTHTHTVTSGSSGNVSPSSINIEQSTFNVYMWKRTE